MTSDAPGESGCRETVMAQCCQGLLTSGARLSSVSGHGGEISGPRPPHGASAATTSNGLCDHTRAMPRPVANIVRAWVYDAPHGAGNFGGGCVVNEDLRCYRIRSELACREIVHRTPPDGEGQARSQARP